MESICVNKYLREYRRNGTSELLHASSPCQGFSKANRNGGKNDAVNNELALTFTRGLRRTKALVGVFENVSKQFVRGTIAMRPISFPAILFTIAFSGRWYLESERHALLETYAE